MDSIETKKNSDEQRPIPRLLWPLSTFFLIIGAVCAIAVEDITYCASFMGISGAIGVYAYGRYENRLDFLFLAIVILNLFILLIQ